MRWSVLQADVAGHLRFETHKSKGPGQGGFAGRSISRVAVPSKPFSSLLVYAQDFERRAHWKPDEFTVWRALSGIFAADAVGAVWFLVGSGVKAHEKVFAATEIYVLGRKPIIYATTRDLLDYYLRCVKSKTTDLNIGFISA